MVNRRSQPHLLPALADIGAQEDLGLHLATDLLLDPAGDAIAARVGLRSGKMRKSL
jgi:hypothetical protein